MSNLKRLTGAVSTLVFVGALGYLAWTNFALFGCRAKQAEAKSNLTKIALAQWVHRKAGASFGASLADIGFAPAGEGHRYRYRIVRADNADYLAIAVANREQFHDVWTVNAAGKLRHTVEGCR